MSGMELLAKVTRYFSLPGVVLTRPRYGLGVLQHDPEINEMDTRPSSGLR